MFSIFRKKKSVDPKPLEEIVVIKKGKPNIAEIMDSGSFIGKYESVEKRHFQDVVIEEYKEPVYESYLTEEDAEISEKSVSIEYSEYIAENLDKAIRYSEYVAENIHVMTSTNTTVGIPVGVPTVMFETDEIINDPSLVSIGRSRVTGQHVYKYLGDNVRTLNDIGIEWNELI